MQRIFTYLTLSLSIILVNCSLALSDITIHNNIDIFNDSGNWVISKGMTKFDAGPDTGSILNAHYFPGLLDYTRGNYRGTLIEMDYCIARPQYIEVNPRGSQYLSVAHYIRGIIYVYHASGDGRFAKAKYDFEQAIQRDQSNYYAYLELARVHTVLGSKERAAAVFQQLLKLNPPEELAQQARQQLANPKSESTKKKSDK